MRFCGQNQLARHFIYRYTLSLRESCRADNLNLAGLDAVQSMSRDKATILYIYDRLNPKNGRKLLLQQHGYQVLEATNGLDGIHMFSSQTVDAVILDCHTPGTSSDAVASQIKHINAKVPIVLLSTLEAQTDTKFESTDLHLSKSQSPTFFVSSLQQLLEGPSKPFFLRWLDNWKVRNQGASQ